MYFLNQAGLTLIQFIYNRSSLKNENTFHSFANNVQAKCCHLEREQAFQYDAHLLPFVIFVAELWTLLLENIVPKGKPKYVYTDHLV